MAEEQQKFSLKVPKNLDRESKRELADDVIQFIQERTKKGLDKNNSPFKTYSESYEESLDFQNAGKSRTKVNLAQTGDTMESIKVLDVKDDEIVIGMEDGTDENDKMAWLIADDNGASRDPLGIKESDYRAILSKYERRARDEERLQREQNERRVSDTIVNAILSRMGV